MQIIALTEVLLIVASLFNPHFSVIKVASKTLTRAGVGLYLFVVCPPPFLPLKSGYFRLLCMIRRHRSAFSSELDGKIGW